MFEKFVKASKINPFIDIDRLHHVVINGGLVKRGAGRTFAMLMEACQSTDFMRGRYAILAHNHECAMHIRGEIKRIAWLLGMSYDDFEEIVVNGSTFIIVEYYGQTLDAYNINAIYTDHFAEYQSKNFSRNK